MSQEICLFCETTVPNLQAALAQDWTLDFWNGAGQITAPVCGPCQAKYLRRGERGMEMPDTWNEDEDPGTCEVCKQPCDEHDAHGDCVHEECADAANYGVLPDWCNTPSNKFFWHRKGGK